MGDLGASGPWAVPIELPQHPAQAGRLRRLIAEVCERCPSEIVQLAQLLGSELITNAINHGEAPITVRMRLFGPFLEVEVSDNGPGHPRLKRTSSDSLGGRGLLLVEEIASAWGVRRHREGRGKAVWFTLATGLA